MTPILIVLALLALGVGIVAWATRRKPNASTNAPGESDTAWNDPLTPDASSGRGTTPDSTPRP